MTRRNRDSFGEPLHRILIWVLLILAVSGGLAIYERQALIAELERESAILQRLAAQRADQHDAHLTALSAIAVASEGGRFDLFLEVAATISRFYPRIDEIQLVPLDGGNGIVGTAPLDPRLEKMVRDAARASDDRIALLPHPARSGHYVMVKRSPNTEAARYGLMLAIDAEKLIGNADAYWPRSGTALGLSLPDGTRLIGSTNEPDSVQSSRPLGSASQPLRLETGRMIGTADLLPPLRTALILVTVTLVYLAVLAAWRQRARTRAAVELARVSALESRLTHASRVNALGEMASGLAHELTQPLTAILAQAQAGRRLLEKGDRAALTTALDETVSQTRRATAIIERFRNWSRPQRAPATAFNLGDALANVEALLSPEAAAHHVSLDIRVPARPAMVAADPVEMEQVIFNLMRNAIQAIGDSGRKGQVTAKLGADGNAVRLDITDDGPGVPEELRDRLFTPFTTSRPDGTGLGLVLSQRLVERAGGEITLLPGGRGATFRIVLPRAKAHREAAQ